jgi:hypothetical protein
MEGIDQSRGDLASVVSESLLGQQELTLKQPGVEG